jgi:hypothetical protein
MQKSQNQERLMNGKYTLFACFGLGVVFAVLLLFIGAQNGPFRRVFAAPPVVMPTSGLHAFGPTGCTNSDLKGYFGEYRIGATDVKQPAAPVSNPLAAVGIIYFDGTGNGNSYQRQSREGALKPLAPVSGIYDPAKLIESTPEKIAYSVSPDCTFLMLGSTAPTTGGGRFGRGSSPAGMNYIAQGVILGNEDEFYMMSLAPPGTAIVVVAKKLPPQASVTF